MADVHKNGDELLRIFLADLKNKWTFSTDEHNRVLFGGLYSKFCEEKYKFITPYAKGITTFELQDQRTLNIFNNIQTSKDLGGEEEEDERDYVDSSWSFDETAAPVDRLLASLRVYRSSGPLGLSWPNVTICLVVGKVIRLLSNTSQEHAEEKAIEFLKVEKDATLFISWSPCGACCKKLLEWHNKYKDHKLTIIFGGLYRLNKGDNKAQLAKLKSEPNFTTRPFRNSDWTDLFASLAKFYAPNDQLEDTQAGQKDIEKALSELKLDE